MDNYVQYYGKPIFLLFKDKFLEKISLRLFKDEYEIYPIVQTTKILELLERYKHSVLLINFDNIEQKQELKNIINNIINNKETKDTIINVLTYKNIDLSLQKTFGLNIERWFNINKNEDVFYEEIKSLLNKNNVIGRRKYLRLNCEGYPELNFTALINNKEYNGLISNISSKAILLSFNDLDLCLETNQYINFIEINLFDKKIITKGKVLHGLDGFNENSYVIIFDIDNNIIERIKDFIYSSYQNKII